MRERGDREREREEKKRERGDIEREEKERRDG